MKTKKLLISVLCFCFCVCLLTCFNGFERVSASQSVYTITGDSYDEDSGLLTYRKVTYSENTYKTMNVTTLDAVGAPVDVSDDAEYVLLPVKYSGGFTDYTCVSIKYKNNGVKKLVMHVDYGAGISSAGVDYSAGFKYVCVDALNSSTWNVGFSKSIDGYDVLTVQFGGYAGEIYDLLLNGFRLYFDYGVQVNSERSFEIFGCTVHELGTNPSFASDPKGCRVSKIKSDDVEIVNGACTIDGTATLRANILDYSTDYKKLKLNFSVSSTANVQVKLDGETVSEGEYGIGAHTVTCKFTKNNYSSLELVVTAQNCDFKIESPVMVATPYVDSFSGSYFTINEQNGVKTISYLYNKSYVANWYNVTAPIRKYTNDYDCLLIEFTLDAPVVMGIMIDDESGYLRNHWSEKQPLGVGGHSFFFSLKQIAVTDSSSLIIYIDPPVEGFYGEEQTKTITFTNIEFKDSLEMPKAEITVAPLFEFDYDGKEKQASGATTNSGETLVYEYKPVGSDDKAYDTDKPVDAGEYDVRITSPLTTIYASTSVYSKLVIKKVAPPTPSASCVEIDYNLGVLYYDSAVYAVSRSENFESILKSGEGIAFGDTLFIKYIESLNYSESDSVSIVLDKREGEIQISINYNLESTKESIGEDSEYSTDGLTWNSGVGKRVKLNPGYIYLFRKKATANSFAGKITYIAVPYRAEAPAIPELESTNSNSITLKAIDGVEYRLEDTVWQSSNHFDYLTNGSKVTVYARYKSTSSAYASEEVSITFTVGTLNQDQSSSSVETNNSSAVAESGCNGAIGSLLSELSLIFTALSLAFINKKRRAVK